MTPAQANLIRATALSILAPGSGIYRDGVREALAVADTETARALNAPRDDTAHLLATEANAQRMMEAVGQAKEDSVAYLHRRMDGWENAHIALCDRLTAMEIAVIAADDAAHVQRSSGNVFHDLGRPDADAKFEAAKEAAARLPDSPDEAGLVREAIWMAIARVDGVPAAAATAATAEVIHTLYGFGVDLRQRVEPNLDTPADSIVAEVRADLLARSGAGIAKYGVTLDRTDLGHAQWLQHGYEEALDMACYLKRAMRELANAAPVEPPHAVGPDLIAICAEARHEALSDVHRVAHMASNGEPDYAGAVRSLLRGATEALQPPAPSLRPLTPEPTEAVLARAGEALAGSLPVYVLAGTGRHPYGDDAWHMETDGVARMFPSKEAAQRWLAAMGKPPA